MNRIRDLGGISQFPFLEDRCAPGRELLPFFGSIMPFGSQKDLGSGKVQNDLNKFARIMYHKD